MDSVAVDERRKLGLDRLGQMLARTLAHTLGQQIPQFSWLTKTDDRSSPVRYATSFHTTVTRFSASLDYSPIA